jgi:hypothetical protein
VVASPIVRPKKLQARQIALWAVVGTFALASGFAEYLNRPKYLEKPIPELSVDIESLPTGGSKATITNISKKTFENLYVVTWYKTAKSIAPNPGFSIGKIEPAKSVTIELPYSRDYFMFRPEYLEIDISNRVGVLGGESVSLDIKGADY